MSSPAETRLTVYRRFKVLPEAESKVKIKGTQWVLTVLSVFVVWLRKFVRRIPMGTSKCAHAVFACFVFFHVLSFFSVSWRFRDARLAPW